MMVVFPVLHFFALGEGMEFLLDGIWTVTLQFHAAGQLKVNHRGDWRVGASAPGFIEFAQKVRLNGLNSLLNRLNFVPEGEQILRGAGEGKGALIRARRETT